MHYAILRGNRFRNEAEQAAFKELKVGDELTLMREPDNKYDFNALMVMKDDLHLGYVAKEIAKNISPDIDAGGEFHCEVASAEGDVMLFITSVREPLEQSNNLDDEIPF